MNTILSYNEFLNENSSDFNFAHKIQISKKPNSRYWSKFHIVINSNSYDDIVNLVKKIIGEHHEPLFFRDISWSYISSKTLMPVGVYDNGNSAYNTDVAPGPMLDKAGILKIIDRTYKDELAEQKKDIAKAEKLLKRFNIKKIEGARKKLLFKRAIQIGNEMYGNHGTHGSNFRFAESLDKLNVYELSERDFHKLEPYLENKSIEFISVNNFRFYLSNQPGAEEWSEIDGWSKMSDFADVDGNVYIADDYDSILDDGEYSSIWIINTTEKSPSKKV
jgi:hypothetical protein